MNDERPATAPPLRGSSRVAVAATLVLVAACSRTPDPVVAPPIVLLPSTASASSVSSVDMAPMPPSDVAASGTVGTLSLPDATPPSASAPMTAGVPPPDPSASVPAAASIGPATPSPGAQPPSVSPGTRQ